MLLELKSRKNRGTNEEDANDSVEFDEEAISVFNVKKREGS